MNRLAVIPHNVKTSTSSYFCHLHRLISEHSHAAHMHTNKMWQKKKKKIVHQIYFRSHSMFHCSGIQLFVANRQSQSVCAGEGSIKLVGCLIHDDLYRNMLLQLLSQHVGVDNRNQHCRKFLSNARITLSFTMTSNEEENEKHRLVSESPLM